MTARRAHAAPRELPAPRRLSAIWLLRQLRALLGSLQSQRLCVAFSGGIDSTVLLAALASLRKRVGFELRALHVHHHLYADADDWAAGAAAQARRLRVPFEMLHAHVQQGPGVSVEAAAREARYAALAAALRAHEVLLTAHHLDDQLETLLLAVLRGGGVAGLAAMPATKSIGAHVLLRPLLPVTRMQLLGYARQLKLAWTDDHSNADERFDRNYLRQRVLPQLYARWPAAAVTAARTAAHMAEAQSLLDAMADTQLAQAADGRALRVSVLRRFEAPVRRNLLRRWLRTLGLPQPDHRRLREMAEPMLAARADALPLVSWAGIEVRRHGDRLLAAAKDANAPRVDLSWNWRRQRWLVLPDGGAIGLLPDRHGDVRLAALPRLLSVGFRRGGERLRAARGRLALKDLLQAQRVAPWRRAAVPLVFDAEQVVAVADLWLDAHYAVSSEAHDAAPAAGDSDAEVGDGDAPGRRGARARFRWRPAADGAGPHAWAATAPASGKRNGD